MTDDRVRLLVLTDQQNITDLTRYQNFADSPPDEDLYFVWLSWVVVASVVSLFCLVVGVGILSSKTTRKNPFNLFLVFLIVPDVFFSANCALTCLSNWLVGHYNSRPMCEWQSWYCMFDFSANAWLNAVIARHMHQLILQSHQGRRYVPPSMTSVFLQVTAVYLYSGFIASWTLLDSVLPIRANPMMGLACLPVEYSIPSTIFFWACYVPAFIGVPLTYTIWVCWDVYKKGILPRTGNTRFLFLFFMRLAAVFVFMWIPTILLLFALGLPHFWIAWVGGTWSHLQGIVSTGFMLTKPDVQAATINMLRCHCDHEVPDFSLPLRASIRRVSHVFAARTAPLEEASVHDEDEELPEARLDLSAEQFVQVAVFLKEHVTEESEDGDDDEGSKL